MGGIGGIPIPDMGGGIGGIPIPGPDGPAMLGGGGKARGSNCAYIFCKNKLIIN